MRSVAMVARPTAIAPDNSAIRAGRALPMEFGSPRRRQTAYGDAGTRLLTEDVRDVVNERIVEEICRERRDLIREAALVESTSQSSLTGASGLRRRGTKWQRVECFPTIQPLPPERFAGPFRLNPAPLYSKAESASETPHRPRKILFEPAKCDSISLSRDKQRRESNAIDDRSSGRICS